MASLQARIWMRPKWYAVATRHIKFGWPYFLLSIGTLALICGVWAAIDARTKAEEANAIARATDRANAASQTFEQFVLRTLKAADDITRMAAVSVSHNSPEEAIRRAEQTNILDGDVFDSLGIQDENGNLVGSTLGSTPPVNYADREYFEKARNGTGSDIVIGVPLTSRITQRLEIPIARRFNKPDGSFGGLVLVQVNAKAFAQGYKSLGLLGSDYIALIGLDGIARAGNIGETWISGRDFSAANVMQQQKIKSSGLFAAKGNTDNVFRYVAYRTLPNYPLVVAFGANEQESLQDFNIRRIEFREIGIITTLLALGFAVVLGLVLRKRDMTNQMLKAKESLLQKSATRDYLTGLLNRASLESIKIAKLREAEAQGFEIACIFIDLDNFGAINAAFGHPIGDAALKAAALSISSVIEHVGEVARIGGDEFLALFRTSGEAETHALMIAGKIQDAIESLHSVAGKRVNLRASLGVSVFPRHATSFEDLVRCADAAMAYSKAGRRGEPCVFSPDMDRAIAKQLSIRSDLVEAVENGQFEVFYQPKLQLHGKFPIGIEALVRWRHPTNGLISPSEFIPVAEDSGLIIQIGTLVLNQACLDCRQLIQEGYSQLSVAVNVSTLQFRQPDLVQTVRNALERAGLPAHCLELELTESMIADDPDAIVQRLEALKKLGISLALDDFGTGYSNLQYLRRFPLDVLKIDRSFVEDIPQSCHANSIALAIIGLAKGLSLKVVAEGVETSLQEEFLMANGCDIGQGYFYGKPMTFGELKLWLNERRRLEYVNDTISAIG